MPVLERDSLRKAQCTSRSFAHGDSVHHPVITLSSPFPGRGAWAADLFTGPCGKVCDSPPDKGDRPVNSELSIGILSGTPAENGVLKKLAADLLGGARLPGSSMERC